MGPVYVSNWVISPLKELSSELDFLVRHKGNGGRLGKRAGGGKIKQKNKKWRG